MQKVRLFFQQIPTWGIVVLLVGFSISYFSFDQSNPTQKIPLEITKVLIIGSVLALMIKAIIGKGQN